VAVGQHLNRMAAVRHVIISQRGRGVGREVGLGRVHLGDAVDLEDQPVDEQRVFRTSGGGGSDAVRNNEVAWYMANREERLREMYAVSVPAIPKSWRSPCESRCLWNP